MQFLQKAIDILNKKGTYYFFTTLVVLLSLILWFINRNVPSGDHYTYLYYIKGFEEGRYSYWYFLKDYIPDTFRNPGFPLFLYGLSFISKSVVFIQFIQWILLMVALYLMLRIIEYYDNSFFLKNRLPSLRQAGGSHARRLQNLARPGRKTNQMAAWDRV